jgi:hypothetical protein
MAAPGAALIACAILTGGAVLRVAGGVFYGLGDAPSEDPQMAQMAAEETSETDSGRQQTPLTMLIPPAVPTAAAIAIGSAVLAYLALYWRRLPLLHGHEPGAGLTAPIQRFQSGVVNDYVTWLVLGLACLGGTLALIVR